MAFINTSGQLETECGVSKYGLSSLEDHSVYVHGFSKIRGTGLGTENAFAWPIHQRTQQRHILEARQDHYQHFCTAQNWRRRVKVWVVSLERSQRICVDGFSKIRGFGWCTENAFAWPIHQRTQQRHILEARQEHHQHFCTAQNWRRRVKVWVESLGRSQRICPRFLENQEFWVVHWKCLRVAYTSKNTTEASFRGSTRPSSTLLRRVKVWVVSLERSQRICVDGFSKIRGSGLGTENALAWPIHQRTQQRHILKV